ncbi:hypothetical protein PG999_005388 [Apiospora kogelbergensis]|uniref:PNPLA domain-containing protein n=1 Tax=Apiospora kogelbergensis TaxID=1337665 RepID=A0AAW0R260_9PEZI
MSTENAQPTTDSQPPTSQGQPELSLQTTPNGKKLLSLDGGGVRGYSSVLILQAIMEEVKKIETNGQDDGKERKPCDYFDLCGGTSTGGLAALMLFRLEMAPSAVKTAYEDLAPRSSASARRSTLS